jgi:hypothetical protein
MRRRTLLMAFIAFAACADPYEGEIPAGDPPARDGGGSETIDAGGSDTSSPSDAESDVDASMRADAGDPCDRDQDGFREKSVACGGDDCDDDDERARPDASFSADMPSAKTQGDWDCSGQIARQYDVNVVCGSLSDCTKQGFTTDVACGAQGQYVTCKSNLALGCTVDKTETRTQGCK